MCGASSLAFGLHCRNYADDIATSLRSPSLTQSMERMHEKASHGITTQQHEQMPQKLGAADIGYCWQMFDRLRNVMIDHWSLSVSSPY